MADKLLQCPFCGGEAEIREIFVTGFHKTLFIAKCRNIGCGAIGSECVKKETAIEKWNNRPSPWHTGTPTEEGWYLLKLKKDCKPYCVAYMDGRHWLGIDDFFILVDDVMEWQKIEEKEDGREETETSRH